MKLQLRLKNDPKLWYAEQLDEEIPDWVQTVGVCLFQSHSIITLEFSVILSIFKASMIIVFWATILETQREIMW